MAADILSWIPLPTDPPVNENAHAVPLAALIPLGLTSGLGWLAAYIMMIRRGFIERWMAVPLIALGGNVAWEFVFSFIFYHPDAGVRVVVKAWFLLDLVIVGQAIAFGRKDFPWLSRTAYGWAFGGLMAISFGVMAIAPYEFGDEEGLYTGYGVNTLLSCAFVSMLLRRKSTNGQTMYVALAKFVATSAAIAIAITWYPDRVLPYLFYATIFVMDLAYIVLLYRQFHAEKISPWRKV